MYTLHLYINIYIRVYIYIWLIVNWTPLKISLDGPIQIIKKLTKIPIFLEE